jgi:hypothetical protein
MTADVEPRRRCRPRSERHGNRRHSRKRPPDASLRSLTVPLPALPAEVLIAAGKARGISPRALVRRVLGVLKNERALVSAIFDDGVTVNS